MALHTDTTAAHARALQQTGEIIAGVRADQLELATPCDKYDVRALLNHVIGATWVFAKVGAGERAQRQEPPPDVIGDDPVAAYAAARQAAAAAFAQPGALERVWSMPFADVPGAVAQNIHCLELTAHAWDLGKATGQLERLDPELGEVVLGLSRHIISPDIRNEQGDPFAAEVPVDGDAPVYDRLAGFLGRRP